MATHRIWGLAEDTISNKPRVVSAAAVSIGRSLKSGASEISCYCIRNPHDVIYWKLHLQALEAAIFVENLRSEVIQGILISLLFAASIYPEASILQLGKHYGIPLAVISLSVISDALTSDTEQGQQIIDVIELCVGNNDYSIFGDVSPA